MSARLTDQDTIFALSSGKGRAGVAVIRMSGQQSRFALETLSGKPAEAASVRVCQLTSRSGLVLDHAVTLFFEAPRSFTGEDSAEFQVHGSRAVIAALLAELGRFPDCRSAEPGEFTRRALENGKIDLLGAEALADLIDAETEAQRRLAIGGQSGRLRRDVEALRADLIETMALLEATIDFSDEADVATTMEQPVSEGIGRVLASIRSMLTASTRAERLRAGLKVVLAGDVNAGKSTLLNALAQRDVAIVSPVAGTTRDRLDVHLDIKGWPVTVMDTAGFRATQDAVETLGIERSLQALQEADLVLHLSKSDVWPDLSASRVLKVRTQTDSHPVNSAEPEAVAISAMTGYGMERLLDRIETIAGELMSTGDDPVVGSHRQFRSLEDAERLLLTLIDDKARPVELAVEDIRGAAGCLAEMIGGIDSDTVRSQIFSRFCIGK